MRIDDPNRTGLPAPGSAPTQGSRGVESTSTQRGSGGGPAASSEAPDQVRLSSLAESLQAADPGSPERMNRLRQLAAEIEAGRYQADPNAIARGLIDEALGPDA